MQTFLTLLKTKRFRYLVALPLLLAVLVLATGSRILYANPLFQSWVKSQIAHDTQGAFQFSDIRGGFVSAHLKDLSLDLKGRPGNVRKVEAPTMKASFAWIPLLQNKLVIRSLEMEGGRLEIKLAGSSPEQTALPVSRLFRLKKGVVFVANFSGWDLELTDCDLEAEQSGSGPQQVISGTVSAEHARLDGLALESVKSRFRIEGGRLWIEKLQAVLPGQSKLSGEGSYALDGKPFLEIELSVDSHDILGLLQAVNFSSHFRGQAKVALQGKGLFTPGTRSLEGGGTATLSDIDPDIALPRLPAFNNAPIFKRVRDIDDLGGKATFQLIGNKILIRELDLKNDEIKITGTAQIGYDRSLSSSLLFNGSKTVAEEIPAIARNVFTHDKEGRVLIPFQLKPDTRNPQADVGDVVNRVISNQLQGLNPLQLFK